MANLFFKGFFYSVLFPVSVVFAAGDEPLNKEQTPLHYSAGPASSDLKGSALNQDRQRADNLAVSLRSAIRSQDTELYSSYMRHLLEEVNIESFLEVLFLKDKKGNNIFHLMAGVSDPKARAFFAQDMQTLLDLFTGRLTEGASLGGVEIVIPPLSEDSLFVQAAASAQDQQISQAKEELTRLKSRPSIEFIQAIYARDSEGRTFMERFSAALSSLPSFSSSEEFVEKWQQTAQSLKQRSDTFLFLKENSYREKPIDIAYQTGNPQAYRVLKQISSLEDLSKGAFIVGAMGVLFANVTLFLINAGGGDPWPVDMSPFFRKIGFWPSLGVIGATIPVGGLGALACYRAVERWKKKKLED